MLIQQALTPASRPATGPTSVNNAGWMATISKTFETSFTGTRRGG